MKTIEQFKTHFNQNKEYIHFNNSGQALISDLFLNEVIRWNNKLFSEGSHCANEMWSEVENTRKQLAHFIGAKSVDQVGFFQTTASALSQAAQMIPLEPGDEVLTWDQEYPSNFYPWREACIRKNAKLIQVQSEDWTTPVSKILEKVTSKTKIIALSWVQYQTGSVSGLAQISRALKDKNIWLVADVIQGVGVMPFHFENSGFDIICGGSHKWLCSGYGGSYAVFKQSKLDQLQPLEFGAMTFGTPDTPKNFNNKPKTTAHKFEPGSKAAIEIIALKQTLDLFLSVGIETINKEALRLTNNLASAISKNGYKVYSSESPIINVVCSETDKEKLRSKKISFAERGPGVRLSLHGYNTDEEVDFVANLFTG